MAFAPRNTFAYYEESYMDAMVASKRYEFMEKISLLESSIKRLKSKKWKSKRYKHRMRELELSLWYAKTQLDTFSRVSKY